MHPEIVRQLAIQPPQAPETATGWRDGFVEGRADGKRGRGVYGEVRAEGRRGWRRRLKGEERGGLWFGRWRSTVISRSGEGERGEQGLPESALGFGMLTQAQANQPPAELIPSRADQPNLYLSTSRGETSRQCLSNLLGWISLRWLWLNFSLSS